jgi:ElaA protein
MQTQLTWHCKHFSKLTAAELYNILRLRTEVFILEQNCLYQDVDGKDVKCFHLFGVNEANEVQAYARVLPQGVSYEEVSVGRVVTSKKARGTGAGKELMKRVIEFISKEFGSASIRISAQSYLIKFYSDFGFRTVGEEYLEDDIPHTQMIFPSGIKN